MCLVFLGPPGSGKGTQAKQLAERLRIAHLATGDVFREAIRAGTPLGRQAEQFLSGGELVPDEIVCGMLKEKLLELRAQNQSSFLLDGFPRTVAQAEALERMLSELDWKLSLVLLFEVDDDEIVRRLSGRMVCPNCSAVYHLQSKLPQNDLLCDACATPLVQRKDDTEEVVRHRLEVYRQQTVPVIEFYRQRGILRQVKGVGTPNEVFERIWKVVAKHHETD